MLANPCFRAYWESGECPLFQKESEAFEAATITRCKTASKDLATACRVPDPAPGPAAIQQYCRRAKTPTHDSLPIRTDHKRVSSDPERQAPSSTSQRLAPRDQPQFLPNRNSHEVTGSTITRRKRGGGQGPSLPEYWAHVRGRYS